MAVVAGIALGLIPAAPPEAMPSIITSIMVTNIIWGIIAGYGYKLGYDVIPGKGITKGAIWGLAIWVISNIRTVTIMQSHMSPVAITIYLWCGFFALLVYGIVLGALYKK
ncbi:hypothetical protein A3K80_03610 [Candidatus Bathyarchaeota archaeon RBG_13_38_9]|nr:MAG: hypothetical protein A3K80_03610 [Candidatus Bathyarchaeota archaeon RBG_13_38_9]